jgi:hypothetical protein
MILLALVFLCPAGCARAGAGGVQSPLPDASENRAVFFPVGYPAYWVVTAPDSRTEEHRMDVAPYLKPPGRVFVPVRYLAYALGVAERDVTWDPGAQKVGLRLAGNELGLQIGSRVRVRNGRADEMDVAPELIEPGRTMLPARFVAEGLGYQVDWDPESLTVVVWRSGPKPGVPEQLKKRIGRALLKQAPEQVRRAAAAAPEAQVVKQTGPSMTVWWLIVGPGCKIDFPPAESNAVAGIAVSRTANDSDLEKARAALAQAVPEETLDAFWPVLAGELRKWRGDPGYQTKGQQRFGGRLVAWAIWPSEWGWPDGVLTARFAKEGI